MFWIKCDHSYHLICYSNLSERKPSRLNFSMCVYMLKSVHSFFKGKTLIKPLYKHLSSRSFCFNSFYNNHINCMFSICCMNTKLQLKYLNTNSCFSVQEGGCQDLPHHVFVHVNILTSVGCINKNLYLFSNIFLFRDLKCS